jgi:antitoxin MazE
MESVKTRLVRIGNSQGVRIPKAMIEQCGIGEEVEMAIKGHTLVIAPSKAPRQGWDQALRSMAGGDQDKLLLPDGLSEESDRTEWTW